MTRNQLGRIEVESETPELDMADRAVFGFSWMLVMALGLMPIIDTSLRRSPSISIPVVIAFFVAVASGLALRRRYSWIGFVLHIVGQIAIWLPIFCMSLAAMLYLSG
jgi:hypothetical protein